MKNKIAPTGLLGLLGVAGLVIGSLPLMLLLPFLLCFLLAGNEGGPRFTAMAAAAARCAFWVHISLVSLIIILAAALARLKTVVAIFSFQLLLSVFLCAMLISAGIGVIVFVAGILSSAYRLRRMPPETEANQDRSPQI